ncbi:hypothetical protein BSKO_10647 [Bryopsis sp. KO-2023]|nr:hypothetical protein BSKO_10647 [Bryopsis sp. KO-2023]
MTSAQRQSEFATEGLEKIVALTTAVENLLLYYCGENSPASEKAESAQNQEERLEQLGTYLRTRDRIVDIIKECDARAQDNCDFDEEDLGRPEVEQEDLAERKKELVEEVSRNNAHMKALIDILRNMLSDAAMWDCCGKPTSTQTET